MPVAVLLVLAPLLVGPASASTGAEPQKAQAERQVPPELLDEAEFRNKMGLPVDVDLLLRLDGGEEAADDEYGVALSQAEAAEIRLRQRHIAQDAPRVRAALQAAGMSGALSGLYMDNSTGRLTVLLSGLPVEDAAPVLRAAVSDPDRLTTGPAARTYAYLEQVQRDIDKLRAGGDGRITVTSGPSLI